MERLLDLPHRGRLRVLDLPGPPGAPVVVLLHGLAATSALNWGPSLQALAQDFRVLAPDHRGHGGGLPLRAPFRLEKCADDIAALTEFLQIDRFVAVGYSMGGAIAQLTWRRHRERVAGLVLCATAARFASSRQRQASYLIQPFASIAARGAPDSFWKAQAQRMLENVPDPDRRRHLAAEIEGTQPAAIIEAAGALARFDSRLWLRDVDVPTTVVATQFDRHVPLERQLEMAEAIPESAVRRIDANHYACVAQASLFVPELREACREVSAQPAVVT